MTVPQRQNSSVSKQNYLSVRALADYLKCSQRTAREYCKRGLIEAVRTPGGHWRIRLPLGHKTRWMLAKLCGEWPFDGSKEVEGEFDDSETAQSALEMVLYRRTSEQSIPPSDEVDVGAEKLAQEAAIKKLISEKQKRGESLSALILKGCVYDFWARNQRLPTVGEIAHLMHISPSEFHRRGHTKEEIQRIYDDCEPIRESPQNG